MLNVLISKLRTKTTYKKIEFVLIPLLILCILAGCVTNLDESAPDDMPLMWLVKAPNGQTMYLFGSIHIADEGLYPLPDVVMDAFYGSDYLVLEIKPDANDASDLYVYEDGGAIVEEIGVELYEKAKVALTRAYPNLYTKTLDNYNPIFWISLLSSAAVEKSGLSAEIGLDFYFRGIAPECGIEVLGIESASEQAEMLNSLSLPLQVAWLESLLDIDANAQVNKKLYDLWKQGDEQGIAAASAYDPDSPISYELFMEYSDVLINQRTLRMTEAAKLFMAEGKNVFFAVGVGHIVGEGGIVDLLIQGGYNVERVK